MYGLRSYTGYYSILPLLLLLPFSALAQVEFSEQHIIGYLMAATTVYAIDMDNDNDVDVLGAGIIGDIVWWENDGDEVFTQHFIREYIEREDEREITSVFAIDLDSDGDIDVLNAVNRHTGFTWWENDGDQNFTERFIDEDNRGTRSVYATDIDGDDDIDVLASSRDDDFTWWENDGDEEFTAHIIEEDNRTNSAYAIDVDGDDDMDFVVSGSQLRVWENDGDQEFTGDTIEDDIGWTMAVFPVDLDGDDDMDVLAGSNDDELMWWKNRGNLIFSSYTIDDDHENAQVIYAIDLDEDGDVDIIGQSWSDHEITWYENDGDEDFTEHIILDDHGRETPRSVFAIDVDGDFDIDILSAATGNSGFSWWANDYFAPPEHFSLISPENESTTVETQMSFTWQSTFDPDEVNDVQYTFYLSTDSLFTDPTTINCEDDTTLTVNDLEDQTDYWWKIKATEQEEGFGQNPAFRWSSETWTFYVDINFPPDPFSLYGPENDTEIDGFPLWLTWDNTTDPDEGDSVRFTVYISPDSTFEDILLTECINAVSDTSVEVIHLTDSTTYWWKVLAEDLHGNRRWSNETWSFTFNWENPGDELFAHSRRSLGENGLNETPKEFSIVSTYPNPFNSRATIIVALPEESHLSAQVHDIQGRKIMQIYNGILYPGCHHISFNANNIASGIYLIRVYVPGRQIEIRKVMLIK